MRQSCDTTIARIKSPTRDYFESVILAKGNPVIIEGAMQDWPALSSWTIDYLKSKVRTRRVSVTVSQDGIYKAMQPIDMSLGEYLGLISSDGSERKKYYITGVNLNEVLPELMPAIRIPAMVDQGTMKGPALFLGRDSISANHMHIREQNVLTQLVGKNVWFSTHRETHHTCIQSQYSRSTPISVKLMILNGPIS